jgi:hypothetical protein
VTAAVPAVLPFPDGELVTINWLRSKGMNAAASVPQTPTRPNLVVSRIGGVPAVRWALDVASLQIDVWGTSKAQARDAAAAALAVLYQMPGQAGADEHAYVTDVDVTLGLTWQPDSVINPPTPRYLFGIAVTLRTIREDTP